MSQVILMTADHPLPQFASGERRIRTVSTPGGTLRVEEDGFSVALLTYYKSAAEDLALAMKPFRYELDLRDTPQDVLWLRSYLSTYCSSGEQIELWNLWVGGEENFVRRFSGAFRDFDLETLKQLLETWQTCVTITI